MNRGTLNLTTTVAWSILIALTTSSCSFFLQKMVEKPKVEFEHVDLRDVSGNGATVLVGLKVENPNGFALHVDSVRYTLDVKGKQIATGSIDKPVEVAAKGSAVVEIPVPVKFSDLFSSVLDLLQSGGTEYHVNGDARIGAFTIPFDKKGEMKLKK